MTMQSRGLADGWIFTQPSCRPVESISRDVLVSVREGLNKKTANNPLLVDILQHYVGREAQCGMGSEWP